MRLFGTGRRELQAALALAAAGADVQRRRAESAERDAVRLRAMLADAEEQLLAARADAREQWWARCEVERLLKLPQYDLQRELGELRRTLATRTHHRDVHAQLALPARPPAPTVYRSDPQATQVIPAVPVDATVVYRPGGGGIRA